MVIAQLGTYELAFIHFHARSETCDRLLHRSETVTRKGMCRNVVLVLDCTVSRFSLEADFDDWLNGHLKTPARRCKYRNFDPIEGHFAGIIEVFATSIDWPVRLFRSLLNCTDVANATYCFNRNSMCLRLQMIQSVFQRRVVG